MRTILLICAVAMAMPGAEGQYKVLKTAKVGGDGGFDYVYADADGRKLYVARSGPTKRISDLIRYAAACRRDTGCGSARCSGRSEIASRICQQ